jgi:hypothetical protein
VDLVVGDRCRGCCADRRSNLHLKFEFQGRTLESPLRPSHGILSIPVIDVWKGMSSW